MVKDLQRRLEMINPGDPLLLICAVVCWVALAVYVALTIHAHMR